ncbi:MAG: response regulator [Gammaproteobacteria bacterium]|nr:response regulator [Gammaproteobacteria bacterium]MDE2249962.1 response regulator [Gammaproteobacteria bacterium]
MEQAKVTRTPGESDRLRRRITIAGIALIALIIGADAYEGWQDYRTAIAANERVQVALGRAIAEQTARLIQEADLVLSDFAAWRESPEGRQADGAQLRERLRSDVGRLAFVHAAAITGADGALLATTQDRPVAHRSLHDRPAFTVPQQAQGKTLYISPPFTGMHDRTRTFALSQRYEDRQGDFAGVVVARVAFDYLADFYAAVDISSDTRIELVRTDGVTVVQYPGGGQALADDDFVRRVHRNGAVPRELLHYASEGGQERLTVLRRIDGYPIVVVVSRPMAGVLKPWVDQQLGGIARTFTLVLLAALLLLGLRAALARHDRLGLERLALERRLAASQRADAVGLLAASMAHDFNNVLTAIVGYAELAGQSLGDTPARANIERLLAATERARLLVRRVLTFDPHRSLSYHPLPLEPVVREVLQQLQASLPPAVTVQLRGLEARAAILGDATEVYQVVMNLCTNAIRAMSAGGTLGLSLEPVEVRETRELALGQLRPGSWLRLSVTDQGVGMSVEQVARAFEPFYTTGSAGQGTGIGLAVVRNIILRMNGALEVDSRPGSGTTICVYWPSVGAPVPPARPGRSEGRGETILVVDDEAELVTLAEDLLASLGYEPVGFQAGQAALAAFTRDPTRFRAVLTDERMPGMRGVELAARIHTIAPHVPIILMTGHRNTAIEVSAAKAGVGAILDKPLGLRTLRAALDRELAPAVAF